MITCSLSLYQFPVAGLSRGARSRLMHDAAAIAMAANVNILLIFIIMSS